MQNSGTLISAPIRPNDSLDQYASAFANEIKGGSHGYETHGEMFAIIEARREWGMLVTVYNDSNSDLNGTYQLKYEYSNTDILDDANWLKLNLGENTSTEWVDSVISILTIEPTLEPFPGDRYLIGTTPGLSPTGTNWNSYSYGTIIAEYVPNVLGSWNITIPTNGMTVRVDNDDNSIYKYEGNYPTGIWKQEKITQVFYIEPSGNGLTYSVSTDPIFNTYSRDLIFLTKFNTANNGAASININGLGYKDIKIVTKNGVRDLIITDIMTNVIYSLTYNGTYFQMTKPFPSDAYNIKYYIPAGEVVTVQENEQYWVYGDLTIDGTLVNYGKVIIANGTVINSGNLQIPEDGQVITIDLFDSPIFNTSDTIQLSSVMTINGPSVSAIVLNNSLTPSHINSVNTATASWILSNDGNGSFQWVLPTSGGLDINSNLFYNLDTVVSATDSTSAIYRTGSINIGTGSANDGRFVVSSSGGTVSLVVDEFGNIYNYDANNNTKFGYQALYNSTSIWLVAIGYRALYLNTTGNRNTAIGSRALYENTTGSNNIGIGNNSLQFNNGSFNVAIGPSSLQNNTIGNNNTAIGLNSLQNNTIGNNNIAISQIAMLYNTVGSENIAIGYESLKENTTVVNSLSIIDPGSGYPTGTYSNIQLIYATGSEASTYPIVDVYVGLTGSVSTVTMVTKGTRFQGDTTIMGADLGTGVTFSVGISSLRSGNYNIGIGSNSLKNNTIGDKNNAVGYQSLYSNTTGNNNVAIGYQVLLSNTAGDSNIGLGGYSLYSNTTGDNNTAIGYQSLQENETGDNNTVLGARSLQNNIIGNNNVAVGNNTLFYNISGNNNTAIGYESLIDNKSDNNVAVGYASLTNNITGSNNTAVGNNSLFFNILGQNNIAIGHGAGQYIYGTNIGLTNSNNSVFIGFDTKSATSSSTNEIVIGYGATGYGSNSVTLGNDNITKTYLKGNVQLPTVPTTSSGTYSILTRNDITGEVEKIIPTYKVYTAILTRSGATGPSATVLENTIGTLTYNYDNVGVYSINSSGLFTVNKTIVFLQNNSDGLFGNVLGASRLTVNRIDITQSTSSGNNDDDWVTPVSIEIRVYN